MSPEELEKQANIILHGTNSLIHENEYPMSWWYYTPSQKSIIRFEPKWSVNFKTALTCVQCGHSRSKFSGNLCQYCYRMNAKSLYEERRDAVDELREKGTAIDGYNGHNLSFKTGDVCGIQMPETEWWDDTDIPAVAVKRK